MPQSEFPYLGLVGKVLGLIVSLGMAVYYLPRIWRALVLFCDYVGKFNEAFPLIVEMPARLHQIETSVKDLQSRLLDVEVGLRRHALPLHPQHHHPHTPPRHEE